MNNAVKHFYFSTKTMRIKKKIKKMAKKRDAIEEKIEIELEKLEYTCQVLKELREIESKENHFQDIMNYLETEEEEESESIEQEDQSKAQTKSKSKNKKDEKK